MQHDQLDMFTTNPPALMRNEVIIFPLHRMAGSIARIARRLMACGDKVAADRVWRSEVQRLTDQLYVIGIDRDRILEQVAALGAAVDEEIARIRSQQVG